VHPLVAKRLAGEIDGAREAIAYIRWEEWLGHGLFRWKEWKESVNVVGNSALSEILFTFR
jgi:hypothetical protein